MKAAKGRSAKDSQMICNIVLGNSFSSANTQQENIRKGNFYFPKYDILISQSSLDTIGEFVLIGKKTLYVISQG